ncbi:MAG: biopolymer transporter ExbD [Marinoscillum sp.]
MAFRNRTRKNSEISTASLPDIVFLLLFFFMVTATIKPIEDKVQISYPKAKAMTTIQMKTLVRELSVGKPNDNRYGSEDIITVGNRIIRVEDIPQWIIEEKAGLPEAYKDQMIVLLKADESVKMGLISDIQQQLRKSDARKVVYRTLKE